MVILCMRNMYQSTFGVLMKSAGMFRYLQVCLQYRTTPK